MKVMSPLPQPLSQKSGRGEWHTPSPRVGGGLGWGLSAMALSPSPSPKIRERGVAHSLPQSWGRVGVGAFWKPCETSAR